MSSKHLLPLILLIIFSCGDATEQKAGQSFTLICIQPFSGISKEKVLLVEEQLNKVYPHVVVNDEIHLPKSAYILERNRYRADSLIAYLRSRTSKNQITLGLTDVDISATKGDIKDWGVIGLGYQPGNACIVSSFRLNKNKIASQFYKVCIHELGHTEGLAHCSVKNCFMRDAEGHNTTDEETEFCAGCKQKLIAKGWSF